MLSIGKMFNGKKRWKFCGDELVKLRTTEELNEDRQDKFGKAMNDFLNYLPIMKRINYPIGVHTGF